MKDIHKVKTLKRVRRHNRARARAMGTEGRPRLAVYRSNKFIYAQLIDDEKGSTIAQASDMAQSKKNKTERATLVGEEIAKIGKAKNVESVVFDKGGFMYTGRVRALAEGARKGGLKF